jgi:hypothetical protein
LSALDSDEEVLSDDLADAALEEDEGDEEQVFEPTFKNPTLDAEALLPMNEDVDAAAPVSAAISNVTEHEENNDVRLRYCHKFQFPY